MTMTVKEALDIEQKVKLGQKKVALNKTNKSDELKFLPSWCGNDTTVKLTTKVLFLSLWTGALYLGYYPTPLAIEEISPSSNGPQLFKQFVKVRSLTAFICVSQILIATDLSSSQPASD